MIVYAMRQHCVQSTVETQLNNRTDQDSSVSHETDGDSTETFNKTSRRRFTRNALVGGTVMLSLSNRAAWGQGMVDNCLSEPTWTSWVNGGDMFVSFDENNPAQVEKDLKAQNIRAAGVWEREVQGVTYICPQPSRARGPRSYKQDSMSDMLN